ncbi:copper chaperone PCu(A)C [Sphingomonas canadensis]|uniref:Copper chaperone PCu(A)C n=1 Tax=Sphingomonas canadensis TaxID=1219257 RepID=A0ABW3H780_9SPHN|nr:copper chaperone PCu(A)C [Sphingomonas canadensis]MCW3834604.1 copper chaperone PCu(A)C [Sphingomonas canadensis]
MLGVLLSLALAQGAPEISAPVAVAAPAGADSAAYAAIAAPPGERLTGASCTCAARVELHRIVRADGDISMLVDPAWDIPAAGLEIRPGSDLHLMLMDLRHPLAEGAPVEIVLRFEKAGEIRVRFHVTRDSRGWWAANVRPARPAPAP